MVCFLNSAGATYRISITKIDRRQRTSIICFRNREPLIDHFGQGQSWSASRTFWSSGHLEVAGLLRIRDVQLLYHCKQTPVREHISNIQIHHLSIQRFRKGNIKLRKKASPTKIYALNF